MYLRQFSSLLLCQPTSLLPQSAWTHVCLGLASMAPSSATMPTPILLADPSMPSAILTIRHCTSRAPWLSTYLQVACPVPDPTGKAL